MIRFKYAECARSEENLDKLKKHAASYTERWRLSSKIRDVWAKNSPFLWKSPDSLVIIAQSISDATTLSPFSLTLKYSLPFLIDLVSQVEINNKPRVGDIKSFM